MSQIENVITTTFRARGNQAIATMGSVGSGLRTIGGVINDNTRMSERLNNQWRAIGTTMRYAIAGTALYGLKSLVTQIAAVNQQLGQMQALSDIGSGSGFSNSSITSLGANLRQTAVSTITPINQINDATINFLSTVQNVKPSQIPSMIQEISRAAKIAQTPVETLTQAATTMQIAFGRTVSPQSISQFSRMWQRLIGIAPGGISAAPSIAQAMPGLASMFQLAPGKSVPAAQGQAQMMTLILGALRTGMPASTAMRGVTYLLQSLAQPTGGARGALSGIGITPEFVQQNGIYAAVMKLLTTIAPVGKKEAGKLGQIDDTSMDALDESNGKLPGISATEMTRLRKMVPRIHGIRAAIILASQMQQQGNVASLGQDLQGMTDVQNQNSREAQQLAKAWKDFEKRSQLQKATVAVNAMALQVAGTFLPVINFASRHTTGLQQVMARHPKAVRDIAVGGVGIAALLGVGRFTGVGRLIGSNLVRANAAKAAISGGGGILGGSPQNPLYVTVVGQLFNGSSNSVNPPVPGGSGGVGNWIKSAIGFKTAQVLGSRVGGIALKGIRGSEMAVAGLGAEMPAMGDISKWITGGIDPSSGRRVDVPWYQRLLFPSKMENNLADDSFYYSHLHRVQQMFPNAKAITAFHNQKINGKAEITVNLDINQNGKIVRKKVHVPLDLWSGGRTPSNRAKPATTRSN